MLQVLGLVNGIQPHPNGWYKALQLFTLLKNFQLSGKPVLNILEGGVPEEKIRRPLPPVRVPEERIRRPLPPVRVPEKRILTNSY